MAVDVGTFTVDGDYGYLLDCVGRWLRKAGVDVDFTHVYIVGPHDVSFDIVLNGVAL